MPFSSLVGNERIKRLLRRAVVEGRISQGLIMAGPRGVGKFRFALSLAQAVNCERPIDGDACGQCLSCRKIERGEHLDVRTYAPDGQFIKIAQMRELSREAQFRPYEGRRRVSIIDEADRLREEAANSILKTLEEPPGSSLILLVTSKPYALLDTIRSRCQMLGFAGLTTADLEAYLKSNFKRPIEEIRMIARLARGSIGHALEIDLGEYREKRRIMIEMVEALAVTRDSVRLLGAAEYLGRKLERDQFITHLEVLMVILSDLFHLKLGQPPETLTNADTSDRLSRIAEALTLDKIIEMAERIERVFQGMAQNLNRQLAMETLLISVA
jgi:DNA polymerase III subunit delta'